MGDYHDLPEPPGDWRNSTNKEKHINYHKGVYGPCIIVTPNLGPLSNGWDVTLIGSDQWDRAPRFAEDVELQEATKTVDEVINALESDDKIEPVEFARSPNDSDSDTAHSDTPKSKTDTDTSAEPDEPDDSDEDDEPDEPDDSDESQDNDTQVSLTEFD